MIKLDPASRQAIKDLKVTHIKRHRFTIANALTKHGGFMIKKMEKLITSGTRSGRVYTYKGRKYTASAPGEPPANRSGRLASNFGFNKTGYTQLMLYNNAFSDSGYPYPFQLDDKSGLNRPYFLTTILKNAIQLRKDLSHLNYR